MTRFLSAALSVLLTTKNLTPLTAQKNVCGVDYTDAFDHCLSNSGCPLGDGCPPEQECYGIPLDSASCIPGPPTPSPTPMLKVCGASSDDAQAKCPDTTQHCPTGDGCGNGLACFVVPFQLCGATTTPTAEPTRKVTESPTEAGPTPSPTPGPWKVCGSTYTDATTNCWANPKCPTGDGCANGTTCFALPAGSCPEPSAVQGVVITPDPTTAPTPAPVPADLPPPSTLGVCGTVYLEAEANFCKNPKCPTGDGCPTGMTCFALTYMDCPDAAQGYTTQTLQATDAPTPEPTPAPTEMAVVARPATVALGTPLTQSPVYNELYCGSDYNDATENCWTNQPCPNGGGCPNGHNCFPITSERCMSDAPTSASPTAPTLAPSPIPTESPVANTYFCGADYTDALASCSEGTACPSGAGCPGDMSCFAGLMCPATAPAVGGQSYYAAQGDNEFFCGTDYTDAFASCSQGTACPSGSGCPGDKICYAGIMCPATAPAAPQATDAPTPASTPSPTLAPTPSPTLAPTPPPTEMAVVARPATVALGIPLAQSQVYNNLYCGSDYNDATENCWTNQPCPNGGGCPNGHNCFPITSESCMSDAPTEGPSASPTTPTRAPSPIPTESPMVNTYFCGTDYTDALASCSEGTACPSGAGCPGDKLCFVGIMCPAAAPAVNEAEDVPQALEMFYSHTTLHCGTTYDDASKNCSTNIPCPNGAMEECPVGQSCFPVGACSAPTNLVPVPAVTPASTPNMMNYGLTALNPAPQTGMGETEPTVDQQATMNQDLPVLAPTPVVEPQTVEMQAYGGAEALMGPTAEEPMTKRPTWDFAQFTYDGPSGSSRTMYGGIFVRSVLLGAVILGAL